MTVNPPLFIILLLFSACSNKVTRLKKSPIEQSVVAPKKEKKETKIKEVEFLKNLKSKKHLSWAKRFLKARQFAKNDDDKNACSYYQSLASEKLFPLYKISQIRSISHCSYSNQKIKNIWQGLVYPSWAKEEFVKRIYQKINNGNSHDLSFLAEVSYEFSKFKKIKSEKITLIKNAIGLTKDQKEKRKYRRRLYQIAPRFNKNINNKNRYKVARDFETIRNFDKSRMLYKKIIKKGRSSKRIIQSWKRLAMTYKLQRNKKLYIKKLQEMNLFLKSKSPTSTLYYNAWIDGVIQFARAVWTENDLKRGRQALHKILKVKIKKKNQLATIYWVLGSMATEENNHPLAFKLFKKGSSLKFNDYRLKDKFLWNLSWRHYTQRNYQKAIISFQKYLHQTTSLFNKNKIKYWMAKSFKKLGKIEIAKRNWSKLSKDDPFGYYGILATKELKRTFQIIVPSKKSFIFSKKQNRLKWLIGLEEYSLAENYLKKINFKSKSLQEKIAYLPLYKQAKWHHGSMLEFFRNSRKERNKILHHDIEFGFPAPYKKIILKNAKEMGLPPQLFYAIIRQESAFNPKARSWADAFGLMQLIPESAAKIAKKSKINYQKADDLYNPNINIALSANLLKQLRDKFHDQFILYVASYNASEKAIYRWIKTRFKKDPLEFIENVPYEETKGYIKLVMRNFIIYQRIFAKESFTFNQNLLKLENNKLVSTKKSKD